MSYDGLMLRKAIQEMKPAVLGGRISKIYQLEDFTFLFTLRTRKNHQLLISASRQNTRMHISLNRFDKPYNPPMFCMFLRKHLEGAHLDELIQIDNDRIARFTLRRKNEMGDTVTLYLYFEALGKDANLILTDDNHKILDCLNHTHPFSEQRTMIPSATYQLPSDDRINPFNEDKAYQALKSRSYEVRGDVLSVFQGVSPLFAKELLHRKKKGEPTQTVFNDLLTQDHYEIRHGKKMVFAPFELTHMEGETTTFASVQALLDTFYGKRENHQLYQQHAQSLKTLVKRQIDKQTRKIEKLNQQLSKNEDSAQYRKMGELLLSYAYQIEEGDKEATLTDYETGGTITIPLDRGKSVIENANDYFAKFKKAKKSLPHLKREIVRAKNERTYFRMIEDQIEHANLGDLLEIRQELMSHGYIKQTSKTSRKKKKRATHDTYVDREGYRIHVGKNNIQNAHLTHEVAKHYHTWFHVKDSPGSHVVVEGGVDEIGETTIRSAAQLAAYHSKMRHSGSVAVDYTEVRNIKKIPGHKGYFVTYKNQRTIYIDPDEAFIRSLEKLS